MGRFAQQNRGKKALTMFANRFFMSGWHIENAFPDLILFDSFTSR